jgi:GNAT superfamily N-acetyltransferase
VLGASAAEPVAFVPAAYVDWTVVRRSERRRGIGRMLKAALALWAAERGIDRLDTEVRDDNTGMVAVNASIGYRPVRGLELFEMPLPPDQAPVL